MISIEDGVECLNSLLRGELAALETYDEALDALGLDPATAELTRLQHEHQEAASLLREHIRERGGVPTPSSGAWGGFANAVETTAAVFGNTAAIQALEEGEEHGVKEYEKALQDESLDPECKALIQSILLPRQRAHVPILNRLVLAYC